MTFAIKLTGTCSDTSLPTLERDQLLSGDNGGVRFLFDTAFGYSYAGGPPADGALITDIAEVSNGSFVKGPTQTVGFSGGGFDFSTLDLAVPTSTTNPNNHVLGPAAWATIQAQQQYMLMMYVRLPTLANWNTSGTIFPLFASSDTTTGYVSAADPILLDLNSTPGLQVRRQTAVGAQTLIEVSPALHYGLVAQVAFWRTAAATGLRIKSSGGTTLVTAAAGSANAADCSACLPRFGVVKPFTSFEIAQHRSARNYRLYRGAIENLFTSGRDPVAVLDADYIRTMARGVFS